MVRDCCSVAARAATLMCLLGHFTRTAPSVTAVVIVNRLEFAQEANWRIRFDLITAFRLLIHGNVPNVRSFWADASTPSGLYAINDDSDDAQFEDNCCHCYAFRGELGQTLTS